MVEQKIEATVAEAVRAALEGAGVDTQVMATLAPVKDKGMEEDRECIAVVKASPRSYSTPTIPACEIGVTVTAIVRADADDDGQKALAAFSALAKLFENWQKCYDEIHAEFSYEGEFVAQGFRLDSGSFGQNSDTKIWTYEHNMTVIGVIQ